MADDAAHITEIELSQYRKHMQLTVKNVGRFTIAKGGNNVGKTSALCQSIVDLVAGAGDEAIREGNKAVILVSMGENLRAKRTITGRGNGTLAFEQRLAVIEGEEEKWIALPEPKTYLLKLLGACSFDPLGWSRGKGEDRKRDLLGLVECSLTEDDWRAWGVADDVLASVLAEVEGTHPLEAVGEVARLYEGWRRDANRDAKAAAGEAKAAAVEGLDAPRTAEEIADAQRQAALDREALVCEKANAIANARAIAGHEATAKAARERAAELDEEAETELLRSNNIAQAAAEHETATEQLADQADAIEVPDTAAIEAEIDRLRMQLAEALKQGEAKHAKMREAQQAEADAKRCHQSAAAHSEMAQQHTLTAVQKRREAGIAEDAAKELAGSGSPEALDAKLSELAKQERALAAEMAWDVKRAALLDANAAAAALDATLTAIREHALPTLLQRAQMPVEGLGVNERDITYNGVDGSQLSDGEKMILAVKIGQARAGDGGVVCLDGLEKLDPSMREKLVEMTRNDKRRYFATLVADGPLEIVDADEAAMEANCPEPIF